MKKNGLTWVKLLSLLVLLPLFLWWSVMRNTVSQYRELKELKKENHSALLLEDNRVAINHENLLTGDYLFKEHLNAATLDGCEIVSFAPSCDRVEEPVSLCRCHLLMKGQFVPLLKLVNSLEREPDIGYAMLRFSHKSGQELRVSLDIDLIQLTLNE